jgi:predicted nuclease of predicted toxin-antitoxin system
MELLVDQNFNEDIVDGLTRLDANLEFTYARHVDLDAAADETILEWCAAHGLVLLTHDRKTIPPLAYARTVAGLPMPGVFLVSNQMPKRQAIDEILLAIHCFNADDCKDQVHYFPL